MFTEFKKFALRGNVMDLAVGVIVGAAFGKIVNSLVNDVLMPPLGLVIGRVNFANLFVNLGRTHYASLADAKAAGAPTLNYGLFLNTIVEFLIVAYAVFLMVRQMNRVLGRVDPKPGRPCPFCRLDMAADATRCPHCTSDVSRGPKL